MKLSDIDIVEIKKISNDVKGLIFKVADISDISYAMRDQLRYELQKMSKALGVSIWVLDSRIDVEEYNEKIQQNVLQSGGVESG